jgi:hypothetical protein
MVDVGMTSLSCVAQTRPAAETEIARQRSLETCYMHFPKRRVQHQNDVSHIINATKIYLDRTKGQD